MIHSRITSKAQTTIPKAVREALGIGVGDTIVYRIMNGVVTIEALVMDDGADDDMAINPFATFTEWADEADCAAFDHL